jgi:prepilin peptidase CpaA
MEITATQAVVFGLLTLPITIWVVVSDLTEMKVRNTAVLALVAVFVVSGAFVLPPETYAMRYLQMAAALGVGFLMYLTTGMGAGDAKFIAAAAPMIAPGDFGVVAVLFIAWSMVLLTGMAIARRSATLRTAAPGWVWFADARRRHIPFGVTLAPTLSAYFALGAVG